MKITVLVLYTNNMDESYIILSEKHWTIKFKSREHQSMVTEFRVHQRVGPVVSGREPKPELCGR